jgi:ribulose-phosphate 3-epimerase
MNETSVQVGPSILTADWLRLGDEIRAAERAGVDFLHLDIMDGRFVPNITFGPLVVEAIRKATALPLDVHLMIEEPTEFISAFVDAGANALTVHCENAVHLHRVVQSISASGLEAAVAINPATSLSALEEIATIVRRILVMSVNPGFGGQSFIPSALDKITRLRALLDRVNPACRIRVDGGVKASNIARIVGAGADSFVVGTALFSPEHSIEDAIKDLRESISLTQT